MAVTARKHLETMLTSSLTQSLKHTLLHTLTNLAVKTHVHLSAHVALLLAHICDPRRAIQLIALKDLRWLGRLSPHGTDFGIAQLLALAKASPYDDVKSHALDVVRVLSEAIYDQILVIEGLEVCKEYLFHPNPKVADIATHILTTLYTNSASPSSSATQTPTNHILSDLASSLCVVITSRFGSSKLGNQKSTTGFTKNSNIFHCIARLVKHRPETARLFTDSFVAILPRITAEDAYLLIHNMTMYTPYNRESLLPHTAALHTLAEKQANNPKLVLGLLVLLERGYTHAIPYHLSLIRDHLSPLSALTHSSPNCAYTLATHSLAHGYPSVASKVFEFLLTSGIRSEPIFCWISALSSIAHAESHSQTSTSRFGFIPAALSDLYTGRTHLSAAAAALASPTPFTFINSAFDDSSTPFTFTPFGTPATRTSNTVDFRFQIAFVDLRIAFLQGILALQSTLLTVPDVEEGPAKPNSTTNGNSGMHVDMMGIHK